LQRNESKSTGERREVIDADRIAGVIIRLVEAERLKAQGLAEELGPVNPAVGSVREVGGAE
jgi:hypothetical protein